VGSSALDGRTNPHAEFHSSQRLRKLAEEVVAGAKDGQPMRKMKFRNLAEGNFLANLIVCAYALLHVARLTAPSPLVSTQDECLCHGADQPQ
jgi:hypothetical protein